MVASVLVLFRVHLCCRGPILAVMVSGMRCISAQMDLPICFLGLSTALANAADLADWLGIKKAVSCSRLFRLSIAFCSYRNLHTCRETPDF